MTVIDVISSARLVPSCTYAGFSVGFRSTVKGDYKEKFTICNSDDRNSEDRERDVSVSVSDLYLFAFSTR